MAADTSFFAGLAGPLALRNSIPATVSTMQATKRTAPSSGAHASSRPPHKKSRVAASSSSSSSPASASATKPRRSEHLHLHQLTPQPSSDDTDLLRFKVPSLPRHAVHSVHVHDQYHAPPSPSTSTVPASSSPTSRRLLLSSSPVRDLDRQIERERAIISIPRAPAPARGAHPSHSRTRTTALGAMRSSHPKFAPHARSTAALEDGITLIFGRHHARPGRVLRNTPLSALPGEYASLLAHPENESRTIPLYRGARHASRLHAAVELVRPASAPGSTPCDACVRLVVMGQNGVRVRIPSGPDAGKLRRLTPGQAVEYDVPADLTLDVDFYGASVTVRLPPPAGSGEAERADDVAMGAGMDMDMDMDMEMDMDDEEEREPQRERLFTPEPQPRELLAEAHAPSPVSLPPSSPPLAPIGLGMSLASSEAEVEMDSDDESLLSEAPEADGDSDGEVEAAQESVSTVEERKPDLEITRERSLSRELSPALSDAGEGEAEPLPILEPHADIDAAASPAPTPAPAPRTPARTPEPHADATAPASAPSPALAIKQELIRAATPKSRAATPPPPPPFPTALDLPALLATTVVFSGSSKLSLPDLVKSLLESQPALRDHGDDATWSAWSLAELDTNPMFGKVERNGRDRSGKPLKPHYFYNPANDPDAGRAVELGGLVRPLRATQRGGGRAIDWRPVGSGRRKYW